MAFPTHDALEELLQPIAQSNGLEIERVTVNRAGKKSSVLVVVDSEYAPNLGGLENIARAFSRGIDEAEERGELNCGTQEYTLEVTTRGVDAPLELPRHWAHQRGRLVRVETAERSFDARIGGVVTDNDGERTGVVVIEEGRPRLLAFSDVQRAVVQIEFASPPTAEMELAEMSPEEALNGRED